MSRKSLSQKTKDYVQKKKIEKKKKSVVEMYFLATLSNLQSSVQ
jgi:hypothetical protein